MRNGRRDRARTPGVLASCTTADSLFPTEYRSRIQPLPCVLLRRVVSSEPGLGRAERGADPPRHGRHQAAAQQLI